MVGGGWRQLKKNKKKPPRLSMHSKSAKRVDRDVRLLPVWRVRRRRIYGDVRAGI
jgi:hypothetical protein